MADLKLGTQIGGNLVWHQGILDLNPVDTKLYFQDQEVLVDTGYQTLKGTMKFNVPANQYNIESLSVLPAGSKNMLRKFRGGNTDTIWHETVQGASYQISTGNTDSSLILQLVSGNAATFQNSVLTNAAQSTAVNSFTRKDYVDAIDNKNVAKAGDSMTGFLDFSDNKGILVSVSASGQSASIDTGLVGGTGDGASKDKANMQIKSWYGVGFSPSAGRANSVVEDGENSIWFNLRDGNMYSVGRMFVGETQEVYSPLNKPTPGDLNAYTKSEIDSKSWLRVKDERAAMIRPSALDPKTMGLYFTNQSDVTSSWVSGFTIKGWDDNYASWSLFSSARADADDKRLWFKHGRTDWMASTRIYHEDDKPTNDELNLVSRAGDEMNGPLTIRNSTFQCVTDWDMRRVMKQLGFQGDAKPVLVLFCPRYIGAALSKRGFVGRVTFNRGSVGAYLQSNYIDISAVTGYTATDSQIHYASGGNPVKLVYVTHNGVEYLAMYRSAESMASIVIDGYCYGADPILISDATGYAITDVVTRERIYSSDNKPTNVDLNLVSRAGDTMTGSLNGPDFIQTTPQSSNGAASARKDYVDAQDAKTVAKAGDIMTGSLTAPQFNASTDYGFVRSTNNTQGMFVGADGRTIIGGGTGALILRPQGISNAAGESVFNNDGTIAISKTGTADNHLVTKKYVDDKVGTAVQSVTTTGAVKSTGGINPVISLANATNAADGAMSFADKAKLDGIPAAAVNRTGDTMTGGLTFVNADCELGWVFNTDYAKIGFKNTADGDTDSYMWFKTGDNGNEYFKWQGVSGANTTDWMSLKSTGLVVAAGVTAPTFTGALAGNAATATNLATARQINGTNFDGSGNITTANWGTARTLTIGNAAKSVNGAGNVSWSLSEIGALPATGGTVSGVLGVTTELNLIGHSASDMADIVWRAPDGTERGRLWVGGTIGADNSLTWRSGAGGAIHKIYHEGNKPTASDVGALSIAGGEMGGVVTFRGSANLLNVADGAKIRYFNGNSTWFHTSVNAAGEFEVSTGGVGETSIATIDYSGKIRTSNQGVLYGDRNKPTAAEVGAAPAGFGLGTYGTGISTVLGDCNLRRQSGFFQGSNIAGIPNAGWTYLFNQAHGNAAGYFGYLAINFAGTQAWIGGQEGGNQKGPYELVKRGDSILAGRVEVNAGSNPMLEYHMPGKHAVCTYIDGSGNYRLATSNGAGGEVALRFQADTGGGLYVVGNGNFNDVNIRSDRRLKKNFVKISGALDKVSQLCAYTYDKKQSLSSNDYSTHEVGLIAQDVQLVLPEAVTTVVNPVDNLEVLTISNSGVNALLVEAIKELTDRVKYLESKLK